MDLTEFPAGFKGVIGQVSLEEMHIKEIFQEYRNEFLKSEKAKAFVLTSTLIPDRLREHPYICYCVKGSSKRIMARRTYEGGGIRGSLIRSRLIKATGHQLFTSYVVFPEFDSQEQIVSATGYRFSARIRKMDKLIVHWSRPLPGAFVEEGLNAARELIHAKTNI